MLLGISVEAGHTAACALGGVQMDKTRPRPEMDKHGIIQSVECTNPEKPFTIAISKYKTPIECHEIDAQLALF